MTTEIVLVGLEDEKDNTEHYERCAKHLLNGNLVAFPTETVYGLGANALDPEAVKRIFEAKSRPLTDPVIVHISNLEMVDKFALTEFGTKIYEQKIFLHFAKTFWPGPLTQVVRAHKKYPPIVDKLIKNEQGDVQPSSFYGIGVTDFVTAATDFVGIRMPSHSVARRLIETCEVPIAAPSANRFGHVSPTTAKHVVEDLSNRGFEILVIEPQKKKKQQQANEEKCCEVGIESTVAKIEQFDEENNEILVKVTLLRRGGVSFEMLTEAGKIFEQEINKNTPKIKVEVVSSFKKVSENTKTGEVAPGQLIRHYSPDVPSFLITTEKTKEKTFNSDKKFFKLSDAVIIDFENTLEWTKDKCLKYYNLSPSGSNEEAANGLFKTMRKAEKVFGAQCMLLPNLMEKKSDNMKSVEDAAVFDRLFRAASGKTASFDESGEKIQECD